MQKTALDVFAYADFRQCLGDFARALKQQDRKFSQRYIAEKVGASSSGWLADVIKGRINLTSHLLIRLTALMGLKDDEAEYFEALVDYQQAGSAEEKSKRLEMLLARKDVKMDLVGQDKFEFYREWYHSAIREMLCFHRFKDDFAALGKKLDPPIRASQAKDSVMLLLKLELIKPDAQGFLRPTSLIIKKDGAFKSLYMADFFRRKMELGMQALDKFAKDDRDISSMTISLSRKSFEAARKELEALRKKLLRLAEREQGPEFVYQCNFQVFPITKK